MLLRPDATDLRLIGLYTSRVVLGVGVAMLVPATLAFVVGETNEGWAFVIGASLAIAFSRLGELALHTRTTLSASHGLATVALSWIVAPLFAAVPLLLSGHYAGWLDAYFEAMSGLTTVGLTLANDLDHLARSVNLWRHLLQFLGGQGIIVVVLTIFAAGAGQIGTLYTGEGRAEKVLPNVVRTARFIWRVALVYAAVGVTVLWIAMATAGLDGASSAYHALLVFFSAFDTGGFAPQSTSLAFYRSPLVETTVVVLMVAGAFSFALHYALWQHRPGEPARNLETRTLALSILGLFAIMALGLARSGAFEDVWALWRHGFFQALSAHTTTGLVTVPTRLYVTEWGALAPAMIVTGMALGGMAGSTAGGIKAIRIGLMAKALRADIRRVLLPENAVIIETYHSSTRRILQPEQVRGAATILLLYLLLYLLGGLVGLFYGYDLTLALFESTAAGSGGGLSVGLVRPDLEWPLKVAYIAQMVIGRLEFVAIFALAGYLVSMVRGRV